jgi:hypothetical protein
MAMRAPWSHKAQRPVHANEPHEFRPIEDAGLATGLGTVSRMAGSQIAMLAMTDRYMRTSACDVPGCGKERDDPIHEPAE